MASNTSLDYITFVKKNSKLYNKLIESYKKNYNKICDILDNYTFKSRDMV